MDSASEIKARYEEGLREFLASPGEMGLSNAYELGRHALARGLGVIDMIGIHHEAIIQVLAGEPRKTEPSLAQWEAIAMFGVECLTPFEMVHRGQEESNAALVRMNETLEQEAKRIAQLLHDEAGQMLATAYLELANAERVVPGMPEYSRRLRAHLDQVREHLRRLAHELHPTVLEDLGLLPALTFLANGYSERMGIPVKVEGRGDVPLPKDAESAIYRIVQEALANISRHAQASRVEVALLQHKRAVTCTVRDNGVGFNVSAAHQLCGTRTLGLTGIRERLAPLNGTLTIDSKIGEGTTLLIHIPLET